MKQIFEERRDRVQHLQFNSMLLIVPENCVRRRGRYFTLW